MNCLLMYLKTSLPIMKIESKWTIQVIVEHKDFYLLFIYIRAFFFHIMSLKPDKRSITLWVFFLFFFVFLCRKTKSGREKQLIPKVVCLASGFFCVGSLKAHILNDISLNRTSWISPLSNTLLVSPHTTEPANSSFTLIALQSLPQLALSFRLVLSLFLF